MTTNNQHRPTAKKTPKMLAVEGRLGLKLERYLPTAVTNERQSAIADYLGVSNGTLGYWLLKLDIRIYRIAAGPGDVVNVTRAADSQAAMASTRIR